MRNSKRIKDILAYNLYRNIIFACLLFALLSTFYFLILKSHVSENTRRSLYELAIVLSITFDLIYLILRIELEDRILKKFSYAFLGTFNLFFGLYNINQSFTKELGFPFRFSNLIIGICILIDIFLNRYIIKQHSSKNKTERNTLK